MGYSEGAEENKFADSQTTFTTETKTSELYKVTE